MSRDWKPGDVAVVNGSMAIRSADFQGWYTTKGRLSDPNVAYAYPRLVINTEDAEQCERLAEVYRKVGQTGGAALDGDQRTVPGLHMQAALREFANPTPPKPEEPTGLGAVVEDSEGQQYIRTAHIDCVRPWMVAHGSIDVEWSDIAAVRVLSLGVEADQ